MAEYNLLDKVKFPKDLRELSKEDLKRYLLDRASRVPFDLQFPYKYA